MVLVGFYLYPWPSEAVSQDEETIANQLVNLGKEINEHLVSVSKDIKIMEDNGYIFFVEPHHAFTIIKKAKTIDQAEDIMKKFGVDVENCVCDVMPNKKKNKELAKV